MQPWSRHVEHVPFCWAVVTKIRVQWKRVNIVYHKVIEFFFLIQITDVKHRALVKPQISKVIHHEDVMRNFLSTQEIRHMWSKYQKLIETVTISNNNCELRLIVFDVRIVLDEVANLIDICKRINMETYFHVLLTTTVT